jgi:hypothetical protein
MIELPEISLSLKQFLTISDCPARWKHYDLYIIRAEQVVFYVGQSYCAFERVWEHIRGGPKGHSIVGRFVLANWPRSGSFVIDLLSAQSLRFTQCNHSLDAAERCLIEQFTPCFNSALNTQPAPLPAGFLPPNTPIKHLRSYKRMLREAVYAVRSTDADTQWE